MIGERLRAGVEVGKFRGVLLDELARLGGRLLGGVLREGLTDRRQVFLGEGVAALGLGELDLAQDDAQCLGGRGSDGQRPHGT